MRQRKKALLRQMNLVEITQWRTTQSQPFFRSFRQFAIRFADVQEWPQLDPVKLNRPRGKPLLRMHEMILLQMNIYFN